MASNFRHDPFHGLTPAFADAPVDAEVAEVADERMPRAARPHITRAPPPPNSTTWQLTDLGKPVMVGALAIAMAIAVFL